MRIPGDLSFNNLQRLPAPFPGSPRHNPGTPNLSSIHSWHTPEALRPLWPFGDDLAVLPDIERRPMHPRGTPSSLASTQVKRARLAQRASDFGWMRSCLHFSPSWPGLYQLRRLLELSYTAQASAGARYRLSKFSQLREKRRRASAFGTSCPPCRTRAAIRLSANQGEASRR